MRESICFSDLHISPDTVEDVAVVLRRITDDILDRLPEAIVCVGDIGAFDSHNKKSDKYKTADIHKEKEAIKNVLCEHFFKPLYEYNEHQREMKKRLYKPLIIFCLGNHDQLEHRWYESMFKAISDRLKIPVYVHDDETLVEIDGIYFKHTFEKGISGSAHTTCAGALKDLHCSCVQGHRHVREVAEDCDLSGKKIFSICLPCATTDRPDWACESSLKWDTGWLRLSWDTPNKYHYEFMEFVDDDRVFALPEAC